MSEMRCLSWKIECNINLGYFFTFPTAIFTKEIRIFEKKKKINKGKGHKMFIIIFNVLLTERTQSVSRINVDYAEK